MKRVAGFVIVFAVVVAKDMDHAMLAIMGVHRIWRLRDFLVLLNGIPDLRGRIATFLIGGAVKGQAPPVFEMRFLVAEGLTGRCNFGLLL